MQPAVGECPLDADKGQGADRNGKDESDDNSLDDQTVVHNVKPVSAALSVDRSPSSMLHCPGNRQPGGPRTGTTNTTYIPMETYPEKDLTVEKTLR